MVMNRIEQLSAVLKQVADEVWDTSDLWPSLHSVHEGYAVILEELDELWDECRKKTPDREKLSKEAIQVAAMAIRFAAEVPR